MTGAGLDTLPFLSTGVIQAAGLKNQAEIGGATVMSNDNEKCAANEKMEGEHVLKMQRIVLRCQKA